jgi:hypothetical protein
MFATAIVALISRADGIQFVTLTIESFMFQDGLSSSLHDSEMSTVLEEATVLEDSDLSNRKFSECNFQKIQQRMKTFMLLQIDERQRTALPIVCSMMTVVKPFR